MKEETSESDANATESGDCENQAPSLTLAEAQKLQEEDVLHDTVWRMAAEGKSSTAIGRAFGRSAGWAWNIIRQRTAHLREIADPDHKAANRGIVVDRLDKVSDLVMKRLENFEEEMETAGEDERRYSIYGSYAALAAVYIKAAETRAKITGVHSDEMDQGTILNTTRLEETARRLALVGPHSRAREMAPAVRAALSMVGVKPADAVEVKS